MIIIDETDEQWPFGKSNCKILENGDIQIKDPITREKERLDLEIELAIETEKRHDETITKLWEKMKDDKRRI